MKPLRQAQVFNNAKELKTVDVFFEKNGLMVNAGPATDTPMVNGSYTAKYELTCINAKATLCGYTGPIKAKKAMHAVLEKFPIDWEGVTVDNIREKAGGNIPEILKLLHSFK